MINPLKRIRSLLTLRFKPAARYFLARRSLQPLSARFGYDRGTPIDRYWIEKFLEENQRYIRGQVLEVTDRAYTVRFGGDKVVHSDVVDIDPGNRRANIIADLRSLQAIESGTYDCIILTHVLGLIDDLAAAVAQVYRVLRPGGVLLITSSCLGPILKEEVYWRLTPHSVKFLLGRHFPAKNLAIKTYGNVLAGQCFWVGMAQEELTDKQLEYVDPRYPCVVAAAAIKPSL